MVFPLHSAFLALPLEGEAKWRFQALQKALEPYEDILRFQNPASPHLTLYFWKEVMEIEYGQIMKQAEKIAAATASFSLRVTEARTFGSRGEDHVIVLDVSFSDELARVKKACPWPHSTPPRSARLRSGQALLSDSSEVGSWHPHITLARIRHPQRFAVVKKKVIKALDPCEFPITFDRLRLYAEIEGIKQTPLKEFPFAL